jgi:hypothetical protein
MSQEPRWEEVFRTPRAVRGLATIVNRMSVPGGWMYVHTVMRIRTWGRDDIYTSSIFVPDPKSPS